MAARTTVCLTLLALSALPAAAWAGEAGCRFENGAVVVSASVAGVAGDYILDPSAAHTQLHDTRAQAAGFAETALTGEVRLAGLTIQAAPVAVTDLDARSAGFVTPIAGIVGADLLEGRVLDLKLTPACRYGLYARGRAPRFGPGERLAVRRVAGVPAVTAGVSDGLRSGYGLFAIDTASAAQVRLSTALAAAVPPLSDPGARHQAPARLRALSFAGGLSENVSAGLAEGLEPGLSGTLGNGLWAGRRLRLDVDRGVLLLAPKEEGPKQKGP